MDDVERFVVQREIIFLLLYTLLQHIVHFDMNEG